jgi:hypothetical protein
MKEDIESKIDHQIDNLVIDRTYELVLSQLQTLVYAQVISSLVIAVSEEEMMASSLGIRRTIASKLRELNYIQS